MEQLTQCEATDIVHFVFIRGITPDGQESLGVRNVKCVPKFCRSSWRNEAIWRT